MKNIITKLSFATLMFLSLYSHAATYTLLNEKGVFGEKYERLMIENTFKDGDVLILENNHPYKILSLLGEGGASKIYEVKNSLGEIFALRLPKVSDKLSLSESSVIINSLIDGYDILKDQGVNISRIETYVRDSYILHEKIDTVFSLKDFLTFKERSWKEVDGKIVRIHELEDKRIYDSAKKSLVEFVKQIAAFQSIGDFHFKQVHYSFKENRWVLLDWNEHHVLHKKGNKENPFTSSSLIAYDLRKYKDYNKLLDIISNHRRLIFLKNKCSNLLQPFMKNSRI